MPCGNKGDSPNFGFITSQTVRQAWTGQQISQKN